MGHHQLGQFLGEAAEAGGPGARQQVEVDADVDAAVAEVPVRGAAQVVGAQQVPEIAQIRAEPGGRHRAVLPARPCLAPVRHPGRRAARVLAQPPQDALRGRVGDHEEVEDVGGPDDRVRTRACLCRVRAPRLHEQPRAAARQPRVRRYEVRGHPLHGERRQRQQPGRRLSRRALVRVRQHGQRPRARCLHQSYDRLREHPERALGAAEGAGDVGTLLGEQRVERVTGDTAGQLWEARAQAGQLALDQGPEAVRGALPVPSQTYGGAVPLDHRQFAHAVRRRAPGHRVRAARVVPDHAAEGAAAVGGGVGAEAQSVRGRGLLEAVEDDTGLDDGRARLGVERDDPVHVTGEVEDDSGAGRLSRDRRAAAAWHDRHAVVPAHGQGGRHVVGVARADHAERDPAVVGRVHGGQRPRRHVEGDLAAHLRREGGPQPVHIGRVRRAARAVLRAKIRHVSRMTPHTDNGP